MGFVMLTLVLLAIFGVATALAGGGLVEDVHRSLCPREDDVVKLEAYSTMDVAQQVINCFLPKVDESFERDFVTMTESTRVPFFSTYCPLFNETLGCLKTIVRNLGQCVSEKEIDGEQMIRTAVVDAIPVGANLLCQEQGKMLFTNGKYFQNCFVANYFISCWDSVLSTSWKPEEHCNELVQARECFRTKVTDCGTPGFLEIYDLVLRSVMNVSSCKKYVSSDVNSVIAHTTANNQQNEENSD